MEGWKNYQTWNVNLWINNSEPIYRLAVNYGKDVSYRDFAKQYLLNFVSEKTPDGVSWLDDELDYDALDEALEELG